MHFKDKNGNKRMGSIKSDKARAYLEGFYAQCPSLTQPYEGDVEVNIDIWYASRRPDLDESVILDAMQDRIYANDRQVKKKVVTWHLDKEKPRAWIRVSPL